MVAQTEAEKAEGEEAERKKRRRRRRGRGRNKDEANTIVARTPEGDAALTDKQDPMLYWLVPILPKVRGADGREFEDFMSKHAKYAFDWEGRTP